MSSTFTQANVANELTLDEIVAAIRSVDPALIVPEILIYENIYLTDATPMEVPRTFWERLLNDWRRKTKTVVIQTPSKKLVVIDYRQVDMGNRIGIFCHPSAADHVRRMIRTLSAAVQREG